MTARADQPQNPLAMTYGGQEPGAVRAVSAGDAPVPPGSLIDSLGIRLTHVGPGAAVATMEIATQHLNQAGVAQAGAVMALADAAAGWGAKTALRAGQSFTTLELNANLVRAARPGDRLVATASPVHLGRTSMVIAVTVVVEVEGGASKTLAEFRCTELVLG
ncbi:PaaI family thioesterase [Nocardioides zeae]|uniref:1,4-dihydroxy-2-naphthoyl-CoA hydrolase n=1 Tax=Nocardioides zeae TaxID=1457234 RepID=A0AAJ1X1L5_9ACTN|nr:PaaI family thioesterase [Nocardioides zeae]MDQ1105713.1 1,4-dihydroxy-2-naphthoyl-CoA hydrolase [Nocardioides zeae]